MKKQKELEPFFTFNNACLYKGSVLSISNFKKEFCDLIITSNMILGLNIIQIMMF
ncbi:hypothetical protein AGMMS49573_11080 [Endomicrobiia bacterium]|nr:hypothetical protein AGMMS49523_08220 [Endomicrobiia bacterium]GHT12874.1 hypothetical protein AGMMS49571_05600 [Endomicrobiia bacterium]GHT18354.1 hypothetical protein AGMMS49573_11080 [Endomicrobiia bacterium]GHT18473.1 hypothetical protein AGMMS49929_00220 [Endomicrobiia bacterium]GHT29250.1 hypothetical protein AGMMS49995_11270 [Endomicrobiia bacterium]